MMVGYFYYEQQVMCGVLAMALLESVRSMTAIAS